MDAWPLCLERLEAELPAEDVHTWLKPLQAEQRSDAMVLYAPNAFILEQVRERYPVSYTHLDVYKRQGLLRAGFSDHEAENCSLAVARTLSLIHI